jgi:hypothetical protein
MWGRRAARQTNKQEVGMVPKFGGTFSESKKEEPKHQEKKRKNERRAPLASQSAAQRNDKFFVRPRLSITFRPYRSSRGRNRDRPWTVGGHALKAKKKNVLESRCRHPMSLVPVNDTQGSYCGPSQAIGLRNPCGTHAETPITRGPPRGHNPPDKSSTVDTQHGYLMQQKGKRTRSTHIGAIRPTFSYSVSTPERITSSPELSMSSLLAVGSFTCPSISTSSSNESNGSVPITSW